MKEAKIYMRSNRDYIITVVPSSQGRAVEVKCSGKEPFKIMTPFFVHHGIRQGVIDAEYGRVHLKWWFLFVHQFNHERADRQAERILQAIAVA